MPIEQIIDHEQGHKVAIWRITESLDELHRLITLSEQDQKKVDSFRLEKRKKEWLACRILLQELTGKYQQVEYTKSGKPFLATKEMHISFSHADGFAAASISSVNTALDIEICSPRVEKVAQRFMHDKEWAFTEDTQKLKYITVIWCAKEALFKYFDESMVVFKEHFRVEPFKIKENGDIQCRCFFYEKPIDLKMHYINTPDYMLVYHLSSSYN